MQEAAKYLPRIKNTTSYWCLRQILTDLYGIEEEPDFETLADRLDISTREDWATKVLDKGNISRVLAGCQWHRPVPKAADRFVSVLIADRLINQPFSSRVLEAITDVLGMEIYEAADLRKAIVELIGKAHEAGAVAVSGVFDPMTDFDPGHRESADRVLSLVMLGQKTNRDDKRTLRSYVMDAVLKACADNGMTFQLMLGTRGGAANERTISAFDQGMLFGYTDLITRHSGVRFDIFTANETLAHQLAVLARNYRNIFVSGSWNYTAFPSHTRKMLRERVEMLPMTKSCGFMSGAESVEWVYAGAKLFRRQLAHVLAQMVEEGYLTPDTAVDVARHYLSENPGRVYRLEG